MTQQELVEHWRSRAAHLERYAPAAAAAFRDAADELEAAIFAADDKALSLAQAAAESGYSVDRLRHKIAAGELPNAGRKGAPRIRRRDLPRRPRKMGPTLYSADADARSLIAARG